MAHAESTRKVIRRTPHVFHGLKATKAADPHQMDVKPSVSRANSAVPAEIISLHGLADRAACLKLPIMRLVAWLIMLWSICIAPAGRAAAAQPLTLTYDLYAAGFNIAQVQVELALDATTYQASIAVHTTGLAGLFVHGHQTETVRGQFRDGRAQPERYQLVGHWHDVDRTTLIDYQRGEPIIRELIPPIEAEREPTTPAMRLNSFDLMSALAQMIHTVTRTGQCGGEGKLFDGRRASTIQARTVGPAALDGTSRSIFFGNTLHCTFESSPLAGWTFTNGRPQDGRPVRGSAWLAELVPGTPPLPARMAFDTRFFGEATLYLAKISPGPVAQTARQ